MVRAILEGRKKVTRRAVKGAGLKWLADFIRLVRLHVLLQGAAAIAKKCPPHQSLQGRADWAATGEAND